MENSADLYTTEEIISLASEWQNVTKQRVY
jgi:hypothetical protein